jgi:hypothetical protein
MITFQEATDLAEEAFFLTPEGQAVADTIDLAIRHNKWEDTPGTRALLFAEILLTDQQTQRVVWPTYSQLLWDATEAAHRSLTESK